MKKELLGIVCSLVCSYQCNAFDGLMGAFSSAKSALMMPGSEKTEAKTGSFPAYNGPRHMIAVGEFKADARGAYGLTDALRTSLEAALQQSNYFDVLDRSDWDPESGERMPGEFDAILRGTYQVFGHVTAIDETGSQGMEIPIPLGGFAPSIKYGGKQAVIRLTAKIVNVKTGRVVAHRDVQGQSNGAGISIAGNVGGSRFSGGKEAKTPIDLAAINTAYELVKFVCEAMQDIPAPGSAPTVTMTVLKIDGNAKNFVIDAGMDKNLKMGDELVLIDEFGFPVSGFKARVAFLQPDKAKCTVVESEEEIQVGSTLSVLR